MTLYDLKNVLDFSFDLADDEISASFYAELDEIPDSVARQIEIVQISRDLVTCKLTNFLRRFCNFHPSKMREFFADIEDDLRDSFTAQLLKGGAGEDITDDGGEAVAYFIEYYLYDFITDFLKEDGKK